MLRPCALGQRAGSREEAWIFNFFWGYVDCKKQMGFPLFLLYIQLTLERSYLCDEGLDALLCRL